MRPFGQPEEPPVSRFGLPDALPPPLPVPHVAAEPQGPLLSGKAIALVITAISIGAIGMATSWLLGRNEHLEPATYIRYALVLTVGVYVVVGALVVTRLAPGVRLRWHTGKPAGSILLGAAIGGTISGVLLAGVSGAVGHLAPDPRIVALMSEGALVHIIATVGITCICAPLIEEVLFRGLLLESLRFKGHGNALLLSGIAFAVWHLNPAALRYYALMGLLLGGLYLKRGLVCSIAAHVAFNGVLTVAALAVVLAPARTITTGDVSFSAPSGWGQLHTEAEGWTLDGPSGAEIFLAERPLAVTPTADQLRDRVRAGLPAALIPGLSLDMSTLRETTIPAGVAVELDVTYEGHGGTFAMLAVRGKLVAIALMNAGSTKAQADFPGILDSLRVD